jgi:hypothetical protein
VEDLRAGVKDVLTQFYDTDFNLLRWVIGFGYDLAVAEEKLRKHLEFRKRMNFDAPPERLPVHPVIEEYYNSRFYKISDEDSSNLFACIQLEGNADIAGLYYAMSVSDFLFSQLGKVERVLRAVMDAEARTRRQHKVFVVIDLEGTKIDKWTWYAVTGSFQTMIQLQFDNYVELIDHIAIINPGKVLHAAFKLLEPLLPQRTKDKLKIYGSDWKHQLAKLIPSNRLPLIYGGTEPSELIPQHRNLQYGRYVIPASKYYDHGRDRDQLAQLSTTRIGRAGHASHFFHVPEGPARLHWYIKSDGAYKFAIYFSASEISGKPRLSQLVTAEPGSDSVTEIYPPILWCGEFVPDVGSHPCDLPGWYYIELSNDSWIFGRKLEHLFNVTTD